MPRRGENIFKRKDGRWEARYVREIALDGSGIFIFNGAVFRISSRIVFCSFVIFIFTMIIL